MATVSLVSLPGSNCRTAPPIQSAVQAAAVHRAGCPSLAPARPARGEAAASATTAYTSAAPGAPVSRLAPPPNRPPRPSPRYQTASAQATEAARARRAVRGYSRPAPSASWITAKARSARTGWWPMTRAAVCTGHDTKAGWPSPAGAITWVANLGVSIAGWSWSIPSRIHSRPRVTWMPRRVTRIRCCLTSPRPASPGPVRTAPSHGRPPGLRCTRRRWRRDP